MLFVVQDVWMDTHSLWPICYYCTWKLVYTWSGTPTHHHWLPELCFLDINVCLPTVNYCMSNRWHSEFSIKFLFSNVFPRIHWLTCITESGDQDQECWIHAVLSVPLHLPNECLFPFVWNFQFWSLYICEFSFSRLGNFQFFLLFLSPDSRRIST